MYDRAMTTRSLTAGVGGLVHRVVPLVDVVEVDRLVARYAWLVLKWGA